MNEPDHESYNYTRARFDGAQAAERYATRHRGSWRDQRERWCLLDALRSCSLPRNAAVLDLPCGTGRLVLPMVEAGFRVTAADSSEHMLARARRLWEKQSANDADLRPRARFDLAEAAETGYASRSFDAVVCNRLLHHYNDSATRIRVLRELSRITRRWVIVSFFNAATWDGVMFHLKARVLRRRPHDRIPISPGLLRSDAAEAGLVFSSMFASFGPISPQCYAILRTRIDADGPRRQPSAQSCGNQKQ